MKEKSFITLTPGQRWRGHAGTRWETGRRRKKLRKGLKIISGTGEQH